MRYYLILILLITTLSLQSIPVKLTCRPGILQRDNQRYILNCESGMHDMCEFELDLPIGWYYYYNATDTTILVVDKHEVWEYSKHFYDYKLIIE